MDAFLVKYGAPTLAGLKTGSLFNLPCRSRRELGEAVARGNRRLNPKGLYVAVLRQDRGSALILLYLAFWALGKLMIHIAKRNKQKASGTATVAPPVKIKNEGAIVGAEIAAIGMALKMYQDEMHDIESHVLTINRVAKAYSPWSSKIYGLSQPLRK